MNKTKMFDKLTNATNTYLSRYCELIDESMNKTKMFDKLTNATNTYLSRYCELIDEQD